MSYRRTGSLEDMFKDAADALERAADRTVRRTGDDLRDRAAARTPVEQTPTGGRPPGTLRAAWKVGEVVVSLGGERRTIEVFNPDRVAPYVEWGTRPHRIDARDGGVLAFPGAGGKTMYAKFVDHPGAAGAHMLRDALSETAVAWERIALEELERWARGSA